MHASPARYVQQQAAQQQQQQWSGHSSSGLAAPYAHHDLPPPARDVESHYMQLARQKEVELKQQQQQLDEYQRRTAEFKRRNQPPQQQQQQQYQPQQQQRHAHQHAAVSLEQAQRNVYAAAFASRQNGVQLDRFQESGSQYQSQQQSPAPLSPPNGGTPLGPLSPQRGMVSSSSSTNVRARVGPAGLSPLSPDLAQRRSLGSSASSPSLAQANPTAAGYVDARKHAVTVADSFRSVPDSSALSPSNGHGNGVRLAALRSPNSKHHREVTANIGARVVAQQAPMAEQLQQQQQQQEFLDNGAAEGEGQEQEQYAQDGYDEDPAQRAMQYRAGVGEEQGQAAQSALSTYSQPLLPHHGLAALDASSVASQAARLYARNRTVGPHLQLHAHLVPAAGAPSMRAPTITHSGSTAITENFLQHTGQTADASFYSSLTHAYFDDKMSNESYNGAVLPRPVDPPSEIESRRLRYQPPAVGHKVVDRDAEYADRQQSSLLHKIRSEAHQSGATPSRYFPHPDDKIREQKESAWAAKQELQRIALQQVPLSPASKYKFLPSLRSPSQAQLQTLAQAQDQAHEQLQAQRA